VECLRIKFVAFQTDSTRCQADSHSARKLMILKSFHSGGVQ